jgi:hypothetical protein
MKAYKLINHSTSLTIMLFTSILGYAQFYPTGGYQGGLQGNGGDATFEYFLEPRNLAATGGDDEVFLEWDAPFPVGEVKYDDNTAEMWYWLNNPSSGNDYFYVRFTSPRDGFLTDIAVLNSASSSAEWQDIRVCPDNGTGKPNLAGAWQAFPSVPVNSITQAGGEWEFLTLSSSQPVSMGTTFYIVTHWLAGSTTGPYVGTDVGSNSGRSAWSVDGGTTWNTWTENFIMRAFITTEAGAKFLLTTEKGNPGSLPVQSIVTGEVFFPESDKIALSLTVPSIKSGEKAVIGLTGYNIYRSETSTGPYTFINTASGITYTDAIVDNNTEYFYVVTAEYSKGESVYSNESSALPQGAFVLPYQNNFDVDNGGFYGKGDWQWGTPTFAGGPPSAYSPSKLWGTKLQGNYSNYSYSWLIQPFDLGFQSSCKVRFATWYQTESTKDFCYLAIDNDYNNVYDVLATYSGSSGGWQRKEIIVPDALTTSYARLAFILLSNQNTVMPGFYIDNLSVESYVELNVKAYLEGPFAGTEMTTTLNSSGLLPLTQPFNSNPLADWYYAGTESVGSIPNANVTDWVLAELRETSGGAATATRTTMVAQQAGFLLKNGNIVGLNGSSNLTFPVKIYQNLFLVIWQRNHLGVMTAVPLVKTGNVYTYNFSTGSGQVYGGSLAHKQLTPGIWGMMSGDATGNGLIENSDKDLWELQAGTKGFIESDFNLNGQANNPDKDDKWLPNLGKGTFVPN